MSANEYIGPERRTYMRLDTDCAIDYVKLSDDLKPVRRDLVDSSYSKNISGAGIKFLSKEKFPAGSFLELHIKIPNIDNFLIAICKVVRCEPEGKNSFGSAVAFVWISKKDRELLNAYVKGKKLDNLRSKIKE